MDTKLFFLGIGLAVVIIFCGASVYGSVEKATQSHADRETLYQVSTISALAQGAFGGIQQVSELKKRGDFGIGTFDALDGEMIVYNGRVYKAAADGSVTVAPDKETTPFAIVTYFDRDYSFTTDKPMNYTMLTDYLTSSIPSKNTVYAVKISGTFPAMKVRSVPEQHEPYPSLVAAAANQSVFSFSNIKGTVVGFYLPGYMNGLNMPGYHLHFISDDRMSGGHILDLEADPNTTIELDGTPQVFALIPEAGDTKINTSKDVSVDLAKVER